MPQKHWGFLLEMSKRFKAWLTFIVVAVVLVALDLWLKYWAANNMIGSPARELIPGILGLTYTRNTGAAFGLFANFAWGRWALAVVKGVLMVGLLWYYHRLAGWKGATTSPEDKPPEAKKLWALQVPIILIFAGGFGNLYDRIVLGYVRDMLAFRFINFPIFNLADIFVVVGCFTGAFVIMFILKDLP